MTNENTFKEKDELLSLQAKFRKLISMFEAFTKVKPNDNDVLDKIEKALKMFPEEDTIGKTINELRKETQTFLDQARRERVRKFKRIEAEFIKNAQNEGKPVTELDNGWRVGMLEIKVKRDQFRVCFLYNHEILIPWSPVGSREDFEKLAKKASELLEKAALPEQILPEVFWNGYSEARLSCTEGKELSSHAVPILDFYRGIRIALFRYELKGQKPDKKARYAEFPRWAFLYNLDRYRAIAPSIPPEKRLGFQSGSQREVSQGKGVVINGLDAREDYKVVCYVVPARPQ